MTQVWKAPLGGKHVSFDDFPPEMFQTVATRHGLHWLDLFYQPASNVSAFVDLLGEMAQHLGIEPPEAKTMGEFRALMRSLESDDDDLPVEYEDGFPQMADGQTTPQSSGSPADSDGPPTS